MFNGEGEMAVYVKIGHFSLLLWSPVTLTLEQGHQTSYHFEALIGLDHPPKFG
jgi:hypothetical protein